MAVEGQDERAAWIAHALPTRWPTVWRKPDPGRLSLELRLRVRLLGVGLLNGVSGETAIAVDSLEGFHGRRGRGKLLKYRVVAILVTDFVALANASSFVLLGRVAVWELRALFNAELKDSTDVSDASALASFA